MKSKWFKLDAYGCLISKRKAMTLENAWEKTLEKYERLMDGVKHDTIEDIWTCGLCNLYNKSYCVSCPIRKVTGRKWCYDTPYRLKSSPAIPWAELEYMFLLLVREATKGGKL